MFSTLQPDIISPDSKSVCRQGTISENWLDKNGAWYNQSQLEKKKENKKKLFIFLQE